MNNTLILSISFFTGHDESSIDMPNFGFPNQYPVVLEG